MSPLTLDNARNEVWIMDAGGGRGQIDEQRLPGGGGAISPDDSQVLFVAEANQRFEPPQRHALPRAGRRRDPRVRWCPISRTRRSRHLGARRRSILIVAQMGVHSEIFQIDLATHAKQLTSGRHRFACPARREQAPAASRLVFLFDEPARTATSGRSR
jgi:hypothetical protein